MSQKAARRGVVTGGTWCCDHNMLVTAWPAEDGLAEILEQTRHGGGPGCNMAIDLKKLDPDFFVETIGVVGDDEDGRLLLAEADAHGIERSQLTVTHEASTNYTYAFSSKASGRRTHIFRPGTNTLLSPDHFDFERTRARILHIGLPGIHSIMDAPWKGDPNGWVTVLHRAQAAGLETNMELPSVSAETLFELVGPCLAHLDMLIVNDFEIGAISGISTSMQGKTDVDRCVAGAKQALASGGMRLVAVHFPTGSVVVNREGAVRVRPSVSVPPDAIIGANGAGDAFAAGMLYGLHESWPLDECITLGHAAAAASLRGIGTSDAIEDWKGCLALAERWGWR